MNIKIPIFFFFFCFYWLGIAQQPDRNYFLEGSYFYGNFIPHNKNIKHLITGHPQGFILSYSQKTHGEEKWQQLYNYPDWGFSFQYQDNKSTYLGTNFSLLAHFNFYFLNRNLRLNIAEGISYNTNPFNLDTNTKNFAFGTRLMATTRLQLLYTHENLFKNVGVNTGIIFLHYSNGGIKAPNSGINGVAFQLGFQYLNQSQKTVYKVDTIAPRFSKKTTYQVLLKAGVNASDYLNLGQQSFWIPGVQASKRLSFKSSIQIGAELFVSNFLKKEIEYLSIAFPNSSVTGKEDYKRVGIFAGYQLHINRISLFTQLGYYVYYPYKFETITYQRVGLNYKITNRFFATASVKTHLANAEAIEWGIGFNL